MLTGRKRHKAPITAPKKNPNMIIPVGVSPRLFIIPSMLWKSLTFIVFSNIPLIFPWKLSRDEGLFRNSSLCIIHFFITISNFTPGTDSFFYTISAHDDFVSSSAQTQISWLKILIFNLSPFRLCVALPVNVSYNYNYICGCWLVDKGFLSKKSIREYRKVFHFIGDWSWLTSYFWI